MTSLSGDLPHRCTVNQTVKYKITHSTSYQYSTPVSVCHNVVILAPQVSRHLEVRSHRLTIRPLPEQIEKRRDMFGNSVQRFSLEVHHSQLAITSTSHVSVTAESLPARADSPRCRDVKAGVTLQTDPNWLSVSAHRFDSPRITRSNVFAEYAEPVVGDDTPVLEAARALTQQIHQDFTYDREATDVNTPTDTAFASRSGVCQDFAHVAVSCLRSLSLPARYVSGYLRTVPQDGKPRLVGADQSHAWVSVYCGSELGWVEFDPTNDCVCGTDHIPIAYGRDYSDVVPIKGVFLGGGEPVLSVSVDVAPEEDHPPAAAGNGS